VSRAAPVLWYRFKGTWRGRVLGYLGVALVIALTGGVAMATLAGARRTQSAYPQFLRSTDPTDLTVDSFASSQQATGHSDALTDRLRHLPQVRSLGSAEIVANIVPLTSGGVAEVADGSFIAALGSTDGLYTHLDRMTAVQGHLMDPNDVHQIEATVDAARLAHWHVGTVVQWGVFSQKQGDAKAFGKSYVKPLAEVSTRVVGIVKSSDEVIEDDVDQSSGVIVLSPRLVAMKGVLTYANLYSFQLRHGPSDVAAVERAYVSAIPAGSSYNFRVSSLTTARMQRATTPEAAALAIFGAIAALITVVVSGLAVSRVMRSGGSDREVLRAMGASRALTAADGLPGAALAVIAGVAVAVVVAVALSPLAPIGPIRPVYPTPGVSVDWLVLLVGSTVLVAVLVGIAALSGWRSASGRGDRWSRARTPIAARAARSAGLSVPAVLGASFALDPGQGRAQVPVRSVLVGTVVAVTTVVATLTFASGLHTLISRPPLYGWNWDVALSASEKVPARAQHLLDQDPKIAAWWGVDEANAQLDGQNVPVLLSDAPSALGPTMLSGRPIASAREVVLAPATLALLHKHIGQTVSLTYGSPSDAPVYLPPTEVRIVGTATLPAIGFAGMFSDHTSMGTGAWISVGIEPPTMVRALTVPDKLENGWDAAFIRFRPGVSAPAGRADATRLATEVDRIFQGDSNTQGDALAVLPVQRPAEVVDYRTIGTTPVVFAATLAAGAALALGISLVASVRRRRHDLAVLKALGLGRRQLGATIFWQATVVGVVGLLVGIPFGIAAGRQLWILFARGIDVPPVPTVPAIAILLVAAATIVFANLVAALPGRSAARTPTALVLRTE
jgi:hypothetical protein